MTLGEAIQAAKNGDTNAMMAVGQYFLDQKEPLEAIAYLEMAGESGICKGMQMSMILRFSIADQYKNSGNFEEAIKNYDKACHWCGNILNIRNTNQAELFTEKEYKQAYEIATNSLFNVGGVCFCMKNYKEGLNATEGLQTDKIRMMHGLLLFMSNENGDIQRQAVKEMLVIENDGFYMPSQNDRFADMMISFAARALAMVFRMGMFGAPNLLNSVQILTNAKNMIQNQEESHGLQEEINRYKRNTLGGYTYTG